MAGPLYPDETKILVIVTLILLLYFFSDEDVGRADSGYLDPFKKAYVEEYLENLPGETYSVISETSDSGQGMSVVPSEIGSEDTSGKCMM